VKDAPCYCCTTGTYEEEASPLLSLLSPHSLTSSHPANRFKNLRNYTRYNPLMTSRTFPERMHLRHTLFTYVAALVLPQVAAVCSTLEDSGTGFTAQNIKECATRKRGARLGDGKAGGSPSLLHCQLRATNRAFAFCRNFRLFLNLSSTDSTLRHKNSPP
jgi:hypothetical protein